MINQTTKSATDATKAMYSMLMIVLRLTFAIARSLLILTN